MRKPKNWFISLVGKSLNIKANDLLNIQEKYIRKQKDVVYCISYYF